MLEAVERIESRRVGHTEDDDAACLRPEGLRVTALLGSGCKPVHFAVEARLDERPKPLSSFFAKFGRTKADRVKAKFQRLGADPGLGICFCCRAQPRPM
jgi:hypothetical protein